MTRSPSSLQSARDTIDVFPTILSWVVEDTMLHPGSAPFILAQLPYILDLKAWDVQLQWLSSCSGFNQDILNMSTWCSENLLESRVHNGTLCVILPSSCRGEYRPKTTNEERQNAPWLPWILMSRMLLISVNIWVWYMNKAADYHILGSIIWFS